MAVLPGGQVPITGIEIWQDFFVENAVVWNHAYAECEPLVRESLETGARVLGADHWRVAESRSLLGEALAGLERYEEAEADLLESYAALDVALPPARRARRLPAAAERLVKLYEAWGKPEMADEWRAKLPEEATASEGADRSNGG